MLSSVPFASKTFLMREAFSVERISIEIDPVLTGIEKGFFFSLSRKQLSFAQKYHANAFFPETFFPGGS